MKKLFILLLFLTSNSFAELVQVQEILSGDTFVITLRARLGETSSPTFIVHIAGVECDAETPSSSNQTKLLENLISGKTIDLTNRFEKNGHIVGWVYLNNKDIAPNLIKAGCYYNQTEDRLLSSSQRANYETIQSSSLQRFRSDLKSKRSLELYKYKQNYFNGNNDPSKNGFQRPQ